MEHNIPLSQRPPRTPLPLPHLKNNAKIYKIKKILMKLIYVKANILFLIATNAIKPFSVWHVNQDIYLIKIIKF